MPAPLEARGAAPSTRPPHPYLVMFVAAIQPGVGHPLDDIPKRALVFLFFMLLLGWISYHLTTPEHSYIGRYTGGFFVYALSVVDA